MDGSVIVPLYVYPSMGAWGPMYDIAAAYPQIQFTAIVNIHNGPSEGALPSSEYWDALGTLNSFENIRTIGYVATTWCERNLSQVLDEVATYSFWGEYDSSLAMHGIFVDETPTQYSSDRLEYLQSISAAVHSSSGLMEGYIVHNPGALPQSGYFQTDRTSVTSQQGPDLTIIFESAYADWTAQHVQLAEMTSTYDPQKLAIILHSVPDLDDFSTDVTLRQILAVGHSIWLTGTNNYASMDAHFPVFVNSLAALLGRCVNISGEAEGAVFRERGR